MDGLLPFVTPVSEIGKGGVDSRNVSLTDTVTTTHAEFQQASTSHVIGKALVPFAWKAYQKVPVAEVNLGYPHAQGQYVM